MSYSHARGSYAMGATPGFGVSLAPLKTLEELRTETFEEMEFPVHDVPGMKEAAANITGTVAKKSIKAGSPVWQKVLLVGVLGYVGYKLYKEYA